MKVLIISKEGDGLGIAHRLTQEGHKVYVWIKDQRFKDSLRNIVERVPSWRPLAPVVDFILVDTVGFGDYLPILQKLGKPYLGISKWADEVELDRGLAMELLAECKCDLVEYEKFSSTKEASALLKRWNSPTGYVAKPYNNLDMGKTYLCSEPELFEWALSTYKPDTELITQPIIPDGVEVSTEGWFNGTDWITPFNHTFEEKKFMPGGSGKMTGCMGNVVVRADGSNKLVEHTVLRMTSVLRKEGYRGPLDINCIVTPDKAYVLEFTPRFGYDAIEALAEGLREPLGACLFDIALGAKKAMEFGSDSCIAVRVSRDPWPFASPSDQEEPDKGMPICGLNEANLKHIFLTDIYLTADGYKYSAGDGIVYKATARGRDVAEARQRVYATIANIKSIDLQWRNDIGLRVPGDMARLKQWGWL